MKSLKETVTSDAITKKNFAKPKSISIIYTLNLALGVLGLFKMVVDRKLVEALKEEEVVPPSRNN